MDIIWMDGQLVVAGPDTQAHLAETRGTLVGVRFKPGVAPGFLGIPADELTNTRVPLEDLWERPKVEQLIQDITTGRPGQALLEVAKPAQPDRFAEAVLSQRSWDIRAMADELNLSERQLHRKCLGKFGYGPKTLHRVLRFGRAMELAYDGAAFADIAHRIGYADQAHLSREVRSLAGATLTEMVRTPT
jgi:AraC-like DNA-binding protein